MGSVYRTEIIAKVAKVARTMSATDGRVSARDQEEAAAILCDLVGDALADLAEIRAALVSIAGNVEKMARLAKVKQ